jgi:hypothetical protein
MINLAGTLGAAGLGAYGANEYSNRLKEIYDDMAVEARAIPAAVARVAE